MTRSVSGLVQLHDAPVSLGADTPSAGGVAQVLVVDADSPNAGSPNFVSSVDADSPNAGSPNLVSSVDADSPNAGRLNDPFITDADSPNAGGISEAQVGNILGRPADGSERPADGAVGAWTSGAGFSNRDNMEHSPDATGAGLTITADDVNTVGQERARYRYRIDAEVELDRRTIDLVGGPVGQTVIFTPSVDQARVLVTRILRYAVSVSGVSVQPEIDLRKTGVGDVVPQAALAFTATDQADVAAAASPSLAILTGENLQLGIDVLATATAYQIEVITLGRVIPV